MRDTVRELRGVVHRPHPATAAPKRVAFADRSPEQLRPPAAPAAPASDAALTEELKLLRDLQDERHGRLV